MPNVIEEVKKYEVTIWGGGKNTAGNIYRAAIALRRANFSLIGFAYFHYDPATMPNSDEQLASGTVRIHYPWDSFSRIMDLLRNEKPIYVTYLVDESLASISTAIEPIGEFERT